MAFKSLFRGCPPAEEPDPDVKAKKRRKRYAQTEGIIFQWLGATGFGFGYKELQQIAQYPDILEHNLGELDPANWSVLTGNDTEPWIREKGEYYYLVPRQG